MLLLVRRRGDASVLEQAHEETRPECLFYGTGHKVTLSQWESLRFSLHLRPSGPPGCARFMRINHDCSGRGVALALRCKALWPRCLLSLVIAIG